MKKLFALALAVVAVSLSGCKTPEYTPPNNVSYGYMMYYISNASFVSDGLGYNSVVLTNGSREDYEKYPNDVGFFTYLKASFTAGEDFTWKGEHPMSGLFEYGQRYRDTMTGELKTESFSLQLIGGTVTIEHISGDKYKVELETTTSELYPLTALFEGNVKIVTAD